MTPEDRELLHDLRRQQLDLQSSMARLELQLRELESRTGLENLAHELPPLPPHHDLPLVPDDHALPALPTAGKIPEPEPLPHPPVWTPSPTREFPVGAWLARLGILLVVLVLIALDGVFGLHLLLGPWGKVSLGIIASTLLIVLGQRAERRGPRRLIFGRTLLTLGLAGLYAIFYAASPAGKFQVFDSPTLGSLLLLWWSAYTLLLAERSKSQYLAFVAMAMAYVTTAMNPSDPFTLTADAVLAGFTVNLLVRHGWAAVAFVGVTGTYLALLRRLLIDENGELVLDTSRVLAFWPLATYLVGVWVLFTAAITMASTPTFRGGKRLGLISLNNAGLAILLLLTAYISGYGHGLMGCVLLTTGLGFLVASRFVGWTQHEPEKVMATYAAQGLTLVTAGIIVLFTGVTRSVLLILETGLLGMASAFSGDRVLRITTGVVGIFATAFLIWEIAENSHHPWIFGLGGALIMLLNAWWARGAIRLSPRAHRTWVASCFYYSALAMTLVLTALTVRMSDDALPPALALTTLVLTFLIYSITLYELPLLAQLPLLAAQALVLFPVESGEQQPWWTTAWVAVVTLVLITWWSRQRVLKTDGWVVTLNLIYALALVGLTYQSIRPWVDPQGWLVGASLLSLAFLVWGIWSRVWAIAVGGQLFLLIAVFHFFSPPSGFEWHRLDWSSWAAAIPLVVVFSIGRAIRQWVKLSRNLPDVWRGPIRTVGSTYLLLALIMLIRWVMAVIPEFNQVAAFLFLGTLFVSWNVRHLSVLGIRSGFVLSAIGLWLYVSQFHEHAHALMNFLTALAFIGFLLQPALLRSGHQRVTTFLESWALTFFSVIGGWLFVSTWIQTQGAAAYVTVGWALYALFLFLFGRLVGQRRYRWCGVVILIAALLRVACYDLWGLSVGYRVLTILLLMIVALGLGLIVASGAGRTKQAA